MTLQKSILHLRTFCPGVFFCKNCVTINKEDFTYKILLSSDYQEVNKCRKFLCFMEFELQCIMMIIIRRIFMQSIMEIRQLLKLIHPPHFHAEYNGNKAIIEIDTARCIKGALPSRQLKLILAWCVLHQDELMQNWELSKDGKPLNRINPLV